MLSGRQWLFTCKYLVEGPVCNNPATCRNSVKELRKHYMIHIFRYILYIRTETMTSVNQTHVSTNQVMCHGPN